MSAEPTTVRGALADHPLARSFAAEVHRIHLRYANEVVGAFSLCPFMKDAESAFGTFYVMLDREPDPRVSLDAVLEAKTSVIHVVFPCIRVPPSPFEKFASALRASLASWIPKPPVIAVFHPDLGGDFSTSHRLVGLLRRAPDPFVQFVPEGLHEGGTVFIDNLELLAKNPADRNFDKLKGEGGERLVRIIEDIHADRAKSYAPFLEELLR